jgi:hypothetical protein
MQRKAVIHLYNMKTFHISSIFTAMFLLFGLSVSSCQKEDVKPASGTGSLFIEWDHLANGEPLELGDSYTNALNESMRFSEFKYFVSNFALTKTDGQTVTLPKDSCYFLITETGGENPEIELKGVPIGEYTGVRFVLGVDSLKSVSPISERGGALDPAGEAAGMYWMWNSGYIFVKAEGTSPQAPLDSASNTHKFRYHIGLFGGFSAPTLNNLKTVELNNGSTISVREEVSPTCHVTVDIMEMFKNPNPISVASNPTVMASPFSAKLAENYKDMFKLHHVHQ